MVCKKHLWAFHAELAGSRVVRWCGQCGGIQTYGVTKKDDLGLDNGASFKPILGTESELMIPDIIEDDDGLYSEGLVREAQPELYTFSTPNLFSYGSNFKKEWTPDDKGEMNSPPKRMPLIESERCEQNPELDEILTLAGVKKYDEENCKGKY